MKRLASIRKTTEEKDIQEYRELFNSVRFSFREGFSDRLMQRIQNMQENDPLVLYYNNLSGLMPKILSFSFVLLFLLGIILFVLNGTLHPENFFGVEKIDNSNFISYLIYQD